MAKKTAPKPVRVIKNNNRKHKTETRIFAREIHENFCVQPGCKFKGKHAQQGVCHTTDTFAGDEDWSYVDKLIDLSAQYAQDQLQALKKRYKGKQLINVLESQVACMWMNQMTTLDELVWLRRKVALYEVNQSKPRRKRK